MTEVNYVPTIVPSDLSGESTTTVIPRIAPHINIANLSDLLIKDMDAFEDSWEDPYERERAIHTIFGEPEKNPHIKQLVSEIQGCIDASREAVELLAIMHIWVTQNRSASDEFKGWLVDELVALRMNGWADSDFIDDWLADILDTNNLSTHLLSEIAGVTANQIALTSIIYDAGTSRETLEGIRDRGLPRVSKLAAARLHFLAREVAECLHATDFMEDYEDFIADPTREA